MMKQLLKLQLLKLKTKSSNNNNNQNHFQLNNLKLLTVSLLMVIQPKNHLINFMNNPKLDPSMNLFLDLNQRKDNKIIIVMFQHKNLKKFLMKLIIRVSNQKHLVYPNLHKIYLILILNMSIRKDKKSNLNQIYGLKMKHQNINYKTKNTKKL